MSGVLITGYPYVRERFFATWMHFPFPESLRFLLPVRWTAKDGKVVFVPPADPRISTTRTYFHDSNAPLVGGLLKGWMPAFPVHLWRMRNAVDTVYACSEPTLASTTWFAFWSRLMGKRFICFTWENVPYEEKLHGLSFIVHRILLVMNLALTNGLVCGNELSAAVHAQIYTGPMAVIPMCGVDSMAFLRNRGLKEHSDLAHNVVFTFVGALGYRKGIQVILRAFPEVLARVPYAHLVIAGDGEYESSVERLTQDAALREHVTRFPWLDQHELVRLLSISDVFLYPSIPHEGWTEQFGYSMAEASLMELPVISTRTGSIGEVVRDGETGVLVAPDDAQQLRDAMIRLALDEKARRKLGEAGREYIREQYEHECVARRYATFFRLIRP